MWVTSCESGGFVVVEDVEEPIPSSAFDEALSSREMPHTGASASLEIATADAAARAGKAASSVLNGVAFGVAARTLGVAEPERECEGEREPKCPVTRFGEAATPDGIVPREEGLTEPAWYALEFKLLDTGEDLELVGRAPRSAGGRKEETKLRIDLWATSIGDVVGMGGSSIRDADDDGPASVPVFAFLLLASLPLAACSASSFFLLSASFRCCSSCSSNERRIASISIN